MAIKPVKLIVAGALCCTALLSLFGCGEGVIETDVREQPGRVSAELAKGDTREKVRALLGSPLIDAKQLRLEVYRESGRDWIHGVSLFPPFATPPVPSWEKVSNVTLVLYDNSDLVSDIKTKNWTSFNDFRISAGGYDFVNGSTRDQPNTLLGPLKTWDQLGVGLADSEKCALVLVMGAWAMERVFVDDQQFVDLALENMGLHNLHGTFVGTAIGPGQHRLSVQQESYRGDFETEFECDGGETLYAKLDAFHVSDAWWDTRISGAITTSKAPPYKHAQREGLRPILWHHGTWYRELDLDSTLDK